MALNYLWIAFFLIAFVVGLVRLIVFGDLEVFPDMMNATFDSAKTGFNISLGLTGALTLWMGLMKVGEKGGMVQLMSRAIGPFFSRLFPELPKNHPAYGSMMMNIAANMLGLDNAATPVGLKAMKELQESNPNKDTASNAQIMFLVLNTSGLTIIPISVMAIRATEGAVNPSDIFLPILLATFFSTLVGIVSVSIVQKINLFDRVILAYLGGFTALIGGFIWYLSTLSREMVNTISLLGANLLLFSIIIAFIVMALRKKENVYDAFIEGAKEGFGIAIKIIPFLVAILVAIAVFRESGTMDFIVDGIRNVVAFFGFDTRFVDALPTAFMKPLSGGAARGMMVEILSNSNFGVDSFVGKVASTIQGSTDTTFYVLAVYFGSVGVKRTRHAVGCGLIADLAGIIASIWLAYLFFG
ncbi:nucleoside recognition domain-containing protein [Carboxylicivirga linearis]|uniref:Spore maturation protein n=1 Tax=Carboxylicivirga linearis TaxID=1628157 RepID=A0ABS5JXF1_9BACT|nr:spore maturation protein [Carboxylicivirga linearis]MBS2099600.1 spore maturation protein [Carboxylicivirga linearis]